jgi:hypothetical protein
MIVALVLGTLLAVGALAFVLQPIFFGTAPRADIRQSRPSVLPDEGSATTSAATPMDDEIEAAVSAYRAKLPSCPDCGPRPEADALFCSNCGRRLRETAAAFGPTARSD